MQERNFSRVRSRAPLRLGLAGGGTDVSPYCDLYGGAVLNATIGLFAHTTIEPSIDGQIHFVALDQQIEEVFPLTTVIQPGNRLELHRGVYNRAVQDFNEGDPLPVTIYTSCDAPAGSGLGSSSTLVVSMLRAFAELLNAPLGEYDLAHLAYEVERRDVALHGGRQDQYAAAFGGINFMEFGSDRILVNPLRIKESILCELEASLVLFFTGQSRSSAAIIAEESRNVEQKNEIALTAMHNTKEQAFRMKDALLRGQINTMGDVMRAAWEQKKLMARSISNSRIDHLYNLATEKGAFCGKVSGAGGGGFMMFLVEPEKKLQVMRTLSDSGDGRVVDCHFVMQGASAWRPI
jgi:D-glycero-alpha-D-manno-heptose-7-phosphate kinase